MLRRECGAQCVLVVAFPGVGVGVSAGVHDGGEGYGVGFYGEVAFGEAVLHCEEEVPGAFGFFGGVTGRPCVDGCV